MNENETEKKENIFSYTWAGGILGFLIVKAVIFNAEDDFLWNLFWGFVNEGGITFDQILEVLTTTTFFKLVAGISIGAIVGKLIEPGTIKNLIKEIDDEERENQK